MLASLKVIDLVQNAVNCLSTVAVDLVEEHSDLRWTAEIKRRFANLGESLGFNFLPKACEPQWLFDFIWFKNDAKHVNCLFKELDMVLESEWAKYLDDVVFDFQKLLIAKAPLKVMIFQSWDHDVISRFERLREEIESFEPKIPGETYLLAAFVNNEKRAFEFRIVWDAARSLVLEKISATV